MDLLDLLAQDNYIIFNKTLAKEIGIESSILFGALCSYQRAFKGQEFFREQGRIIEDTCLTEYSVRKAIKDLIEKGLINVEKKGLPAKYYYQINTTRMIELLSTSGCENDTTRENEIRTTRGSESTAVNNNKDNNNNKNNNSLIDRRKKYFQNDELNNLFYDFLDLRKKLKAVNSDRAIQMLLSQLSKYDDDMKIQIINKSIVNSWKGLFPLREDEYNKYSIEKPQEPKKEISNEKYDELLEGLDI